MRKPKLNRLCFLLSITMGIFSTGCIHADELDSNTAVQTATPINQDSTDDFMDEDTVEAASDSSADSTTTNNTPCTDPENCEAVPDGEQSEPYQPVGTLKTEAVYSTPSTSPAWSAPTSGTEITPSSSDTAPTTQIDRSPTLYSIDQHDQSTTQTSIPQTTPAQSDETAVSGNKEASSDAEKPGILKRMTNYITSFFR